MAIKVAWEWVSTKIVSPRRSLEVVAEVEGFFNTKKYPKTQVSMPSTMWMINKNHCEVNIFLFIIAAKI